MIGFFIADGTPTNDNKLVKAHAEINSYIVGTFYFPPLNRSETSTISQGTRFFGVLDDVSGFGACLVAVNDDFAHRFDYNVSVNGDLRVSENASINGKCKAGSFDGVAMNTSITLTPGNCLSITEGALAGTGAQLVGVQVILK